MNRQARVVDCPGYNSFCGVEKLHPFDSQKYGNIFNILQQNGVLDWDNVLRSLVVPRSLLLEIMSAWSLLKLNYSVALSIYV